MLYKADIFTPLGYMVGSATVRGIVRLEFSNTFHRESLPRASFPEDDIPEIKLAQQHLALLERELSAYFSGVLTRFSVPIVLQGTPFQERVWQSLRHIPYGVTISYAQQAKSLGIPSAIRAIARANGQNKLPLLVPCHRVIGADGSLTGYAGGVWRKQKLLVLEGAVLF